LTEAGVGYGNHFEYDSAGNIQFTWNMVGPAEERASFFGADGTLRAAEYRWALGSTAGALTQQRYSNEEYRYDALGRRIWVKSVKTCNDVANGTQQMPIGEATECRTSLIRRVVWDGDRELVEIQMPHGIQYNPSQNLTVTTTPSQWENDGGPVSIQAFPVASGNQADANPYLGRVIYAHGLEIDRPVAVTRIGYSTVLDLVTRDDRVENKAPFTIVPYWDARGDATAGVFSTGEQLLCNIGCVGVAWPWNFSAYDRQRSLVRDNWHGSVLEGRRDKSGLSYARNRYYDPVAGRFTQEDPIGLAGGMNLYGFAAGDPINFSDPFGLCPAFITGRPCSTALAIGVGFVPILGDAIDITSALVGQDLLTGETLSGVGVAATLVGTVLGSGKLARMGVDAAGTALKSLTKGNFRGNLSRLTGGAVQGAHAHHIFPQKFADRFASAGINVHDPRFGAWWEAGSHLSNAAEYNRKWERFLSVDRTRDEILTFGREISAHYGVTAAY
jgi:RHS repeat-associated protein